MPNYTIAILLWIHSFLLLPPWGTLSIFGWRKMRILSLPNSLSRSLHEASLSYSPANTEYTWPNQTNKHIQVNANDLVLNIQFSLNKLTLSSLIFFFTSSMDNEINVFEENKLKGKTLFFIFFLFYLFICSSSIDNGINVFKEKNFKGKILLIYFFYILLIYFFFYKKNRDWKHRIFKSQSNFVRTGTSVSQKACVSFQIQSLNLYSYFSAPDHFSKVV